MFLLSTPRRGGASQRDVEQAETAAGTSSYPIPTEQLHRKAETRNLRDHRVIQSRSP